MPAHISHVLFAEDALRAVMPDADEFLKHTGNVFRFGAQGPDIFYHNQRTRPLALRYGSLIHRRSFGAVVAHMARTALMTARRTGSIDLYQAAYLLGFATHAELDRCVHPFVISRAGWVKVKDKESNRYRRCHTFLERLLDVVALREFRSQELHEFDFFSQIYCGASLPYTALKMLVKAITTVYPMERYKSRNRRRIENAYIDSTRFYTLTDHRNPLLRQRAREIDEIEGFRNRRIAVFHFPKLGQELDPANLKHQQWQHPCDSELISEDSFVDLFIQAHKQIVPRLRKLVLILGLGNTLLSKQLKDSRLDLKESTTDIKPCHGWLPAARRNHLATTLSGDEEQIRSDSLDTVTEILTRVERDGILELKKIFGDQGLGATLNGTTCIPRYADPLPLDAFFENLNQQSQITHG